MEEHKLNLEGLPPELLKQLRPNNQSLRISDATIVLEIIKSSSGKYLTIDEVIVEFYHKTQHIITRIKMNSILYNLQLKQKIERNEIRFPASYKFKDTSQC